MLSIIVPVYNSAKYLERCVNSLLAQTYHDLEVLLIDDGSTDDSGTLCDAFSSADSRVRVIHKYNGGVSSARNTGIEAAKGQFLAFVDSDDYCAPDMYEKLFAKMSDDVDIVQCEYMLDYGDSQIPEALYDVSENDKISTIRQFLLSGLGGLCCSIIVRQDLIHRHDLSFPEYLTSGEDFWFMLRLLANAKKLTRVPEPLYYYNRVNDVSITHSVTMGRKVQSMRGAMESLRFIQSHEELSPLEKEMCWGILRFKTYFLYSMKDYWRIREQISEANTYIKSCPLLSRNMKFVMRLVFCHLDLMAYCLMRIYMFSRVLNNHSL